MKKPKKNLPDILLVRMDPKLKQRFAILAKIEGRSQSSQVRVLVAEFVDRREAQERRT